MDQVHENKVCIVGDDEVYKCDALVTNKTKTPLMIMSADCIGILFYDSVKKVIAVAHAGRNGTFLNISSNVIQALENEFSSNPSDIKVVLGPSIQKCCYEVLPEMVEIVRQNFGEEFCDGRNIDLQGINKKQLLDVGLKEKNINISSICTKCNGKDYFSYRNDKNCGRFAGIIELN
jgi:YfiH family protein